MAGLPTAWNALVRFVAGPPPPPAVLPTIDMDVDDHPMIPGGLVWRNPPQQNLPAYAPPLEQYEAGAFDQSTLATAATATEDRFRQFMGGDISGSEEVDYYQLWQGIHYIAAHGDNMIVLFGQPDANGNLVRRTAVKDVQCNPAEWFMPFYWSGGYDVNGIRDYSDRIDRTESMETYVHRKVAASGSSSIVAYHGRAQVNTDQWRHRFFMEYCPHGSLQQLIKAYRDVDSFEGVPVTEYPRPNSDLTYTIPNVLISEPFVSTLHDRCLENCFNSLAKAALVMEQGSDEAPVEGWKDIIHRDIKPSNIWLQDPPSGGNAQWPLYPQPKLGDFGIAVESSREDPPANNPRAFRGMGTMGHFAPEQLRWTRMDDFRITDFPRMDAKTNVWEIGSVIYALVYRCQELATPDFESLTHPRPVVDPCGPIPAPGYSHTLLDLMWECLLVEPSDRPSPSMLLKRTFNKQLDFDNVHYKGMRTVKPNSREPWHNTSRLRSERLHLDFDDDYALGMAWDDLPRRNPYVQD